MKQSFRRMWVIEMHALNEPWGWEATVPAYVFKKDAVKEYRKIRAGQFPPNQPTKFRVVKYVAVTS